MEVLVVVVVVIVVVVCYKNEKKEKKPPHCALLFGGEYDIKMACVGRCQDGSGGGISHWRW